MSTVQWLFVARCPACGESIVLPRQSPLGMYESQQYLPSPMWPIAFLCNRHAQVCECSAATIDLDPVQRPNQSQPGISLWEIEVECAHSNCGLPHYIYAKYRPDKTAQDVVERLLKANPRIRCSGNHDVLLKAEKMKVTELPF